MKKYLPIFFISLSQEFAYRLNFIMWRIRNIIQILLVYFLWDTIFAEPGTSLFGYNRAQIITYVFGVLILKSIVTSARSVDVAGEISRGDLINYLVKPVNYFRYWLTRDVASKVLNLAFSVIEGTVLYFLLRPSFYMQKNIVLLFLFFVSLILAVVLYYILLMLFSTLTFWALEQAWGMVFLLFIFTEFLGGIVFPIDILPPLGQKILYALPFAYLVFTPLQIYLGKFSIASSLQAVGMAILWVLLLSLLLRKLWNLGLREFRAEGR